MKSKVYESVPGNNDLVPTCLRYRMVGFLGRWLVIGTVHHEFIKRLQKRYQPEGICIPYPVQTVRLVADFKENEIKR